MFFYSLTHGEPKVCFLKPHCLISTTITALYMVSTLDPAVAGELVCFK